jgi:hypothetical protein
VVRTWIIAGVALLLVVFLVSFLPPYVKATRLSNDLREARQENSMGQLRDLAAQAYFQAIQKNYGLAAGTSSRFFNRVPEVAGQMTDPGRRKSIEDLVSFRDKITAGLAKGDPSVLNDLQALFVKTRQATGNPE